MFEASNRATYHVGLAMRKSNENKLPVLKWSLTAIAACMGAVLLLRWLCFSWEAVSAVGGLSSGVFAALAFVMALKAVSDNQQSIREQQRELKKQREAREQADWDELLRLRLIAFREFCFRTFWNSNKFADEQTHTLLEKMPADPNNYFWRVCREITNNRGNPDFDWLFGFGEAKVDAMREDVAEFRTRLATIADHKHHSSPAIRAFLADAKIDQVLELLEIAAAAVYRP
ncbi:hypothetical protein [Neorhizobium sp. NCHU2750]|uniref:hypothetical protein n=1 Tax=Neorhizobium sp. NCHU2750 TaxID=1825976 RepID=UPI000E771235|nr:hypothetical protein NCHU2750_18000 [Neorhizobium sp. NCHU2750]